MLLSGSLKVFSMVFLLAITLFVPAETVNWNRAWTLLFLEFFILEAWLVVVSRRFPSSIRHFLKGGECYYHTVVDRNVRLFFFSFILFWLILIPCDVFSIKAFSKPRAEYSLLGLGFVVFGLSLMLKAIEAHRFRVPQSGIENSAYEPIYKGVYRSVRHPFYAGVLWMMAGTSLWLESYLSLMGVGVLGLFIGIKIKAEESKLMALVDGYEAYCARVRYRILPGVL